MGRLPFYLTAHVPPEDDTRHWNANASRQSGKSPPANSAAASRPRGWVGRPSPDWRVRYAAATVYAVDPSPECVLRLADDLDAKYARTDVRVFDLPAEFCRTAAALGLRTTTDMTAPQEAVISRRCPWFFVYVIGRRVVEAHWQDGTISEHPAHVFSHPATASLVVDPPRLAQF